MTLTIFTINIMIIIQPKYTLLRKGYTRVIKYLLIYSMIKKDSLETIFHGYSTTCITIKIPYNKCAYSFCK